LRPTSGLDLILTGESFEGAADAGIGSDLRVGCLPKASEELDSSVMQTASQDSRDDA
jgi:hypothetical protein